LLLAASAAAKDRLAPFQIDPPEGFVPDAETAAKISEVVLIRLFGEANTDMERPLVATLKDGIWTVVGTMPPHHLGGVAELHISKKDGKILFMAHGQRNLANRRSDWLAKGPPKHDHSAVASKLRQTPTGVESEVAKVHSAAHVGFCRTACDAALPG
jgi:NTF2 fold immunity protein of polymorphic toxin system component